MSNQPKKYGKFLATAATAALVASAIVPVASAASTFPDVDDTNSHAENINALVEAGLINGYEDGNFKPNAKLTRGHVVKMLGRWVEAQGRGIPADWNTVQRFDDVAIDAKDKELVKYAALVKDTGVFKGSEGDLNADDSITRENMALLLDRAYKAVFGKSLAESNAGVENLEVADLTAAKEEAHEAIQALRNLGISNVDNFQPKETVTRAQFVSFLNRTTNANGEVAGAAIKSLTATANVTATNQLTVTFDDAVNTEAAQFAVVKGSTAITVSDIKWNEGKTEAVLTIAETFVDATYTVTVGGVDGQDLTASVTTTREKVTSIKFLSDYLVFTGGEEVKADKKTYKEAVITFAVYNQYGEDITDEVNESYFKDRDVSGIDVFGNESNIEIDNGKFTVWVEEDEDHDAAGSVEFTYERNEEEITVKHDVTLSDESEPAQVEIFNIYSPTNDELNVGNLEDGDEFHILFKVTDQYGVEIDPKYADDRKNATGYTTILKEVQNGISVKVSNDDVFEVEDEEGGNGEDGIEVINLDGEYYFAINIKADDTTDVTGGENTVTFRSKATGEEISKAFTVASSNQPHSIELGLPKEVIAGDEDIKLPVFVRNTTGDLLTDVKALNKDLREKRIKIDGDNIDQNGFTFVEEGGNVFLKFKSVNNETNKAKEYKISIEVDQSRIENKLNIVLEPNAHPEKIVGLKDKGLSYALLGDKTEVEPKSLLIEDQYGRTFNDISEGTGHKNYDIHVTSSNTGIFTVTKDGKKAIIQSKGKGSATIEFKLVGQDVKGNVIEHTLDVIFHSIEAKDFDSFKVESNEVLYGVIPHSGSSVADDAGVKVFGLVGDLKVEIFNESKNAYTVSAESNYLNTDGKTVTADTAAIRAAGILDDKTDRYEAGILVTINETGETIRHTITLAREDAKVKKFSLNDLEALAKKKLADITVELTATITADGKLDAQEMFGQLLEEGKFDIKDQYDNKHVSFSEATGEVTFFDGTSDFIELTISGMNSENDNGLVSSNGTNRTTIDLSTDGVNKGDSFNLTLTIDGQSQTLKVYVK